VKSPTLYLILAVAVLAAGAVSAALSLRGTEIPSVESNMVPEVTSVAQRPTHLLPEVVVTGEMPRLVMPAVNARAERPALLHAAAPTPRSCEADWRAVQD
jgi:hypothetical protein